MPAPRIDFELDQGSTLTKTLTIIGSDGQPVSFTGASAEMQLRTSYDAAPSLTLSSDNGRIALGSNGLITLSLTPSASASLTAGEYLYDLEVTSSAGAVSKYAAGVITVRREVTRDE